MPCLGPVAHSYPAWRRGASTRGVWGTRPLPQDLGTGYRAYSAAHKNHAPRNRRGDICGAANREILWPAFISTCSGSRLRKRAPSSGRVADGWSPLVGARNLGFVVWPLDLGGDAVGYVPCDQVTPAAQQTCLVSKTAGKLDIDHQAGGRTLRPRLRLCGGERSCQRGETRPRGMTVATQITEDARPRMRHGASKA